MKSNYLDAVKNRRSIYSICNELNISQECVQEIVKFATLHTPTAFNSQSTRAVVLFGKHHEKLWNIVMEKLRAIVPAKDFPTSEEKIKSFAAGAGTVLYFEDQAAIKVVQEKFPAYKDNFARWAIESSGMMQHIVWTRFAEDGVGATVQHYGELIGPDVRKEWGIPETWHLVSQMPFGNKVKDADPKEFSPIEDRVKIFK